jgi:hypothetical protein
MNIGRLQKVPLRELWVHEAHAFTHWLADNLDVLSAAIDMPLTLVQREAVVGSFNVDLLTQDGAGQNVVIENQLERTDHDHLGKLVTYLSNLDAKVAVWITTEARIEHEKAVHWLNESLPEDVGLYLLRLEAYKIGDSDPAPMLTLVAGPSLEGKKIGQGKVELAERHVLRREFWKQLLDRAKRRTTLHASISPPKDNWISAGSGRSGITYNYTIRMNDVQVELYIYTGNVESSRDIFDGLSGHKAEIEAAFGDPLQWLRDENRSFCSIRYVMPSGGLLNKDRWTEIQDAMIDAMVRLEKAVKPFLKK